MRHVSSKEKKGFFLPCTREETKREVRQKNKRVCVPAFACDGQTKPILPPLRLPYQNLLMGGLEGFGGSNQEKGLKQG